MGIEIFLRLPLSLRNTLSFCPACCSHAGTFIGKKRHSWLLLSMHPLAFAFFSSVAAPWPAPPRTCLKSVDAASKPGCAAPSEVADVLIIGGTGFMGAPTARLLQQEGRKVLVLSRGCENTGKGTQGRRPEPPIGAAAMFCDRKHPDFAAFLQSAACPRIVVDFQAYVPAQVEAILQAHRVRPFQQYILVSTNYIYPGGPEGIGLQEFAQPITELDAEPLSRVQSLSNRSFGSYGGGKLQVELRLRQAAQQDGFPALILRPPAAVGPGGDSRHERMQRLLAELPPFQKAPTMARISAPASADALAGQQRKFRVVFSGDIAAAVGLAIKAIEGGKVAPGEAFNVASGQSITIDEYAASVARALGVAERKVSADPRLQGATPELPMKPFDFDLQGSLDTAKAERVLGFKPTAVDAFIKETVDWHRAAIAAADVAPRDLTHEARVKGQRATLPPSWNPVHAGKRGVPLRKDSSSSSSSPMADRGSIVLPGDTAAVLQRGDMYVERDFLPAHEVHELKRLVGDPVVQEAVQLLDDWDRRLWRNSSFKLRVVNATESETRDAYLLALEAQLRRKTGNAYIDSSKRQRYVHQHSRKLLQLNELAWRALLRAHERVRDLALKSEIFDMSQRRLDQSYNIAFHRVGSDFPPHVDWAPNCIAGLVYFGSEGEEFEGGELQMRGCPGVMDCPVTRDTFMGVYATLGRPANCSGGDVPLACEVMQAHRPRAGDLVVIPAESAHAVSTVSAGTRVAMNFWLNCPPHGGESPEATEEKRRRNAALGVCPRTGAQTTAAGHDG